MATGKIRRIIELILDPKAARKAEKDTQDSLNRAASTKGLAKLNKGFQAVTSGISQGFAAAGRIVAQAAAAVLDAGKVPTYQHDLDNHASGKVADAAGFADQGWRFLTAADTPEDV